MTTTTIQQFREQCAKACEETEVFFDINVWMNSTKQEMSALTALELARLIRALPLPVMPEQAEPVCTIDRVTLENFMYSNDDDCSVIIRKPNYFGMKLFSQDPTALLAHIAALEAENQKLKEGREFDNHVMLQMAGDLGAISHHLGIPDNEGGADPILEKIEEMEAELEKYSR